MTIPASTTGTAMPASHRTLIDMTVPLMGRRWQRDRIVLSDGEPGSAPKGSVRVGLIGIALSHADQPRLAQTAPQRIALDYNPADPAAARPALETSPDAVAGMFTTGATGVFATIDRFAREASLISDPGSLGGSVSRYEAQLERADDRLSRIAEQQENLRERLTRDLVASERRVAASQSTLDFLRAQVAAWSSDDN